LGGPGCSDGILGIGLALAPAALAVGAIYFDQRDALGMEVPCEAGPVAAGPFDADELEGPEALEPARELAITRTRRGEALHAQQGTSLVEGGRHVEVEVCVDPTGDAPRDSGHRHLFLSLGAR
jgi:hypothetical protein